MSNPMKDQFRSTYHSKFSKMVGGAGKNEIQPDRAERITGITPSETIPKAPNSAIPQVDDERRTDDPPYSGKY